MNFAEEDQKNNCVFTGRPVLVHEKEIRVERADVYILPDGGYQAKVFIKSMFSRKKLAICSNTKMPLSNCQRFVTLETYRY